jgi:putative FmdB family regulatory protein
MPMYDFQCTQCEHVFEEVTPSDAAPPLCPECSATTERLMSAPNFKVQKRSDKAAWHTKKALSDWKEQQGKKQTFAVSGKPQKKSPA